MDDGEVLVVADAVGHHDHPGGALRRNLERAASDLERLRRGLGDDDDHVGLTLLDRAARPER